MFYDSYLDKCIGFQYSGTDAKDDTINGSGGGYGECLLLHHRYEFGCEEGTSRFAFLPDGDCNCANVAGGDCEDKWESNAGDPYADWDDPVPESICWYCMSEELT